MSLVGVISLSLTKIRERKLEGPGSRRTVALISYLVAGNGAQIEGGNVIPMKTVIVDDHPVVRKGLRLLMESEPQVEIVGEASNGLMALEAVRTLCPDLLLLDISMPEMNGLEVLRRLRAGENAVQIIILSNHSDTPYVEAALNMGANGYVGKDSGFEVLMLAIEAVREGIRFIDPKIPHKAA
jgi:DNA-binding NarL/FixJ family response regulator